MILKKQFFSNIFLTNSVFAFFPISFILGNLVTNLNLILFCLLAILNIKSKITEIKINFSLKIIFLFFFIVFLSTAINLIATSYFEGYSDVSSNNLFKSIIFFRFFLMLTLVYFLNQLDILNFQYIFISSAAFPLIVSIDVIFQYLIGFNLIGLEGREYHNSGFFGDELVSGGFIQNFSSFSILFLAYIFKDKKLINFLVIIIAICVLGAGCIFSGNRMPAILYFLSLILIFIFNKNLRKIIPIGIICLLVLFKVIVSYDKIVKLNYESIYRTVKIVLVDKFDFLKNDYFNLRKNIDYQEPTEESKEIIDEQLPESPLNPEAFWIQIPSQKRLMLTAIDIWQNNMIIGNGIKSFRMNCKKFQGPEYNLAEDAVKYKINRLCSNHPHNYYFEILTEAGILGIIITLVLGLLFLIFIYKNFKYFGENRLENLILAAATISLLLVLFPFKSTGSIFTTNNAAYITLMASIIINHKKLFLEKKN
mgnify:CR=1 FL=1